MARLCPAWVPHRAVCVTQIKEILPHRYPFLLVDKVIEFEPGKKAVGIKKVRELSILPTAVREASPTKKVNPSPPGDYERGVLQWSFPRAPYHARRASG